MELPWWMVELLLVQALIVILGFVAGVSFEAFKRRSRDEIYEAHPVIEDPNSLKQSSILLKSMSLIIPAYNEDLRLSGALDETMSDQQRTNLFLMRIAFDFVRKYSVDKVRVILLGRNYERVKLSESVVKQGVLHSRGELLLMLDADGATKVNDLEKLEYKIGAVAEKELQLSTPCDSSARSSDVPIVAFGSRAHLEEKALATGFHIVVLLTAGPGIRDTQCGFKMFTRAAARKLFTNIRLKR